MTTNHSQEAGHTYKPGTLAYLDTFCFGLVPCKVTRVDKGGPHPGWIVGQGVEIQAKVTANRGAYHKGQTVTLSPSHIVPRNHVIRRSYTFRVSTNFSWID